MVKTFLKNIILFNDQRKVFWLLNPAKTCCSFLLPHRSFTKSLHFTHNDQIFVWSNKDKKY